MLEAKDSVYPVERRCSIRHMHGEDEEYDNKSPWSV